MRTKITNLFQAVAEDYQNSAELELHQGHDVHAFYRLQKDPTKVIHLQGYPGMSNENQAHVFARLMDYQEMINIRNQGTISIGNEHEAVIKTFPNFEFIGKDIPYDKRILENMLEENCPELTQTTFQINLHHRYDLRSWLRKNFPFVETGDLSQNNLKLLEERADEITKACHQIETIDKQVGSAYIKYYQQDWKAIKQTTQNKDYPALARALNTLFTAIDWE